MTTPAHDLTLDGAQETQVDQVADEVTTQTPTTEATTTTEDAITTTPTEPQKKLPKILFSSTKRVCCENLQTQTQTHT